MKTAFIRLISVIALLLNAMVPGTHASTNTVTSTADSGAGTLREALASAADGDTIDASGISGTITLTSGELVVSNSVTILGPGPASLAVDGNAASRGFHIGPGVTANISSLTITNAAASPGFPSSFGAGIYNDHSTLTVSNCTVSGNSAGNGGLGGGIYNNGEFSGGATLTVIASTLNSNSALSGGGIYNNGSGNNGGTLTGSATLTVNDSTLSDNMASSGGGIVNDGFSQGSATLTVSNCTLSGNSATGDNFGGGLGGGIYNNGDVGNATLTVIASTLSGNSATGSDFGGLGGGIFNYSDLFTATLTVSASTLSGNSANLGGGIFNYGVSGGSAILMVSASTLSGNSAGESGGGIYNDIDGGSAMLTISASTLSSNSAASGGGCIFNTVSTLEIGDTILNAGTSGGTISNLPVVVASRGYNISSDNGGGILTATGDRINTDPRLDPAGLQDNGGPTLTIALLCDSPALDKGKRDTIAALASDTDQRGLPRPVDDPAFANATGGDGSDIGAFEMQPGICIAPPGPCSDMTGTWSNLVQTCKTTNAGLQCKVKGDLLVQNTGSLDAPTSFVRYYLSSDATSDAGDTFLKQVATGKVKLVKSKKKKLSAKLPAGVSGSGQFILAVIDADHTVDECSESNNLIVFGPLP